MLFFGNKIDRLVSKLANLIVKEQKTHDKMCATNSMIENKMQKLSNKSFVIKQNTDNKIADIRRKIKKTRAQIKLEKAYYSGIGKNEE